MPDVTPTDSIGQRFIQFVYEQPADRPIRSHASWARCAVGDFAREVLNHNIPDTMEEGVMFAHVHADPVIIALHVEFGSDDAHDVELFNCALSDKPTLANVLAETTLPRTYGEMAEMIRAVLNHQDIDVYL